MTGHRQSLVASWHEKCLGTRVVNNCLKAGHFQNEEHNVLMRYLIPVNLTRNWAQELPRNGQKSNSRGRRECGHLNRRSWVQFIVARYIICNVEQPHPLLHPMWTSQWFLANVYNWIILTTTQWINISITPETSHHHFYCQPMLPAPAPNKHYSTFWSSKFIFGKDLLCLIAFT